MGAGVSSLCDEDSHFEIANTFVLASGARQRKASSHSLVHGDKLKVNSTKNIVPGRRGNKKDAVLNLCSPAASESAWLH